MSVRTNALGRSVSAIALGGVVTALRNRDARHEESLGEHEQQFQVPFTAVGRATMAWGTKEVEFELPFVETEHRDADVSVPQFSFGYAITSDNPVIVVACVVHWNKQDNETYGATVAFGLMNGDPTLPDIPVKGVAHLTFQGYGAPYDEDNDDPDVESD